MDVSHLFQVKDWNANFESAKSREYGTKSQAYMPTKHGLGYRRLLSMPNGEAMFGAWCSMCQVLSRHPKPREGYLTDTGRASGVPWTAPDVSLLTGFSERTVQDMLSACLSPQVNWLIDFINTDTTRIPQGYYADTSSPLPLHSPLHSPSPPPPPSETDFPAEAGCTPKPPKKKPGKPRAEPKPPAPYRKLTDYWCEKWEEAHGNKYPFLKKDGNAMSLVWDYAKQDLDRGCEILDNYLACGDKFYGGHPLTKLASDLPRFAAQADEDDGTTGYFDADGYYHMGIYEGITHTPEEIEAHAKEMFDAMPPEEQARERAKHEAQKAWRAAGKPGNAPEVDNV